MTMSTMNKAKIIAELENMAVARLFSDRPWLADPETASALHRKLVQMGLVEQVRVEPETWRDSPLGKELDVELFKVFMGLRDEWDVPFVLQRYRLIGESEADAIWEQLSEDNAESVLSEYVRRAYFDYGKATKALH
jgi:hypothetical protein